MKTKLAALEELGLVINKGELDGIDGWWIFNPKSVKNTFIPDIKFKDMLAEEIVKEAK